MQGQRLTCRKVPVDPLPPSELHRSLTAMQRLLSPMVSSRASGHNHIAVIRTPGRELALRRLAGESPTLAIGIHHGIATCPLLQVMDRRCRPVALVRASIGNV